MTPPTSLPAWRWQSVIVRVAPMLIAYIGFLAGQIAAAEGASPPGEATYSNPLLPEETLADPDVLKLGDTYYLYATSHGRGYDVYVSHNLIDWTNKGLAFNDPRGGAWAPDLFRPHGEDDRFYLYYTDTAEKRSADGKTVKQIGVADADGPLGPFTDRGVLVTGAIDAHLFQDADGRMYLYYVVLDGFRIMGQEMTDPLTPAGEPVELLHPTAEWETTKGFPVTEGPFVLRRGDAYYLMYSGAPADSPDYGIGYATSDSPLGPFVKHPGNPIARRTETVLGPGHHCVVEGLDGRLWMVYHQKRNARSNYDRFLAVDPLWFDDAGVIHARVTRGVQVERPQ